MTIDKQRIEKQEEQLGHLAYAELARQTLHNDIFSLGPVAVVYGGQHGDEGKGKVATSLLKNADYIAVGPGGGNAGHTVVFNDQTIGLHELPGGAIIENALIYIGQGRIVNINDTLQEMDQLEEAGCTINGRVTLAGNAQVNLKSIHRYLDKIIEEYKGKNKVGSTQKGIGPSYAIKALRTGITINMLCDETDRENHVKNIIQQNTQIFSCLEGKQDEIFDEVRQERDKLMEAIQQGHINVDHTNTKLNNEAAQGKKIGVEVSQGHFLSLDGPNYPFVTSSNTDINGVPSALGINMKHIGAGINVMKMIKSKVGTGTFITHFDKSVGEEYANKENEKGVTTGRPRDTGYFDMVEARACLKKCKTDILVLTKADVLAILQQKHDIPIKHCIGYKDTQTGDRHIDTLPRNTGQYDNLEPIWSDTYEIAGNMAGVTDKEYIPHSFKQYLDAFLDELGYKGNVILGTGPKDDEYVIYR